MGDEANIFFRGQVSRWHWVAALALLATLGFGESWVPTQYTVSAYSAAERCQTFRIAEKQVNEQISEVTAQLGTEQAEAKRTRSELEDCGKQRGIGRLRAPVDETLLAELCADEYEAWLAPGMRVRVLRRELADVKGTHKQVTGALQWRCGAIPEQAKNLF